jgi:hypothetical protein
MLVFDISLLRLFAFDAVLCYYIQYYCLIIRSHCSQWSLEVQSKGQGKPGSKRVRGSKNGKD